ncbi:hypothetical protein [Effusibacillus dendaii]|uniref:Uncharacterized protein n=1 Tax=Effusibacillus dendaii TaxID=2743772 RepID=A0A7I8DEH0_9BACL|nr:hypothetical protein [Effusibacillus dendaii]BCJ88437.1 hypothetical protein skT53_34220 [Effusibacillus dendaii]
MRPSQHRMALLGAGMFLMLNVTTGIQQLLPQIEKLFTNHQGWSNPRQADRIGVHSTGADANQLPSDDTSRQTPTNKQTPTKVHQPVPIAARHLSESSVRYEQQSEEQLELIQTAANRIENVVVQAGEQFVFNGTINLSLQQPFFSALNQAASDAHMEVGEHRIQFRNPLDKPVLIKSWLGSGRIHVAFYELDNRRT